MFYVVRLRLGYPPAGGLLIELRRDSNVRPSLMVSPQPFNDRSFPFKYYDPEFSGLTALLYQSMVIELSLGKVNSLWLIAAGSTISVYFIT